MNNYFLNHMPNKISYIKFLVDKPYFSKTNKHLFRDARPNYGATVVGESMFDWHVHHHFMLPLALPS
jgi:hypothetical protein